MHDNPLMPVIRVYVKYFYEMTEVKFDGLSIQRVHDDFKVVFKGTKRGGLKVFSSYRLPDLHESLEQTIQALADDGGRSLWHPDRFR